MDGQNTNPQNPQNPTDPAQTPQAPQPVPEAPQPATPAPITPQPSSETPQTAPEQPATPTEPAAPAPAPESSTGSTDSQPASSEQVPAATPTPPTPTTESLQATQPLPDMGASAQPASFQPPNPKKGMNWLLVLSLVILLILLGGSGYFYMLSKSQPAQQVTRLAYPTKAAATPTPTVSMTPAPSGTQSATKGTVSGTICYPSSGIPAGTITAKDVATSKIYTQAYAGTSAGAKTAYTFPLPAGTYHLRFTPTQYPTTIGYYTDYSSCVGNPTGPNCSGQKVRPLLSATVSATLGVSNVNLCDYYYPPSTPPQF